MLNVVLDLIKGLIAKSPARLIGYGSTLATLAAVFIAGKLGVTLDTDTLLAVGLFGAAIVTELIRRFVYSPQTTQAIAIRAADTGNIDIGSPPKGEQG